MSITDELREWWVRKFPVMDKDLHEDFTVIADRIDAEHEEAITSVMNDALYHANDESMAELGWVRLPKDADGEYIRIGDVMEKPDGYKDRLFAVDGMILYSDRWTVQGFTPCKLHHHTPTVEDVLREFVYAILNQKPEFREENIAEYAAKLRLAKEDA